MLSPLADRLRRPGTVLLDAPRPDADTGRRGARLFAEPRETLVARRPEEVSAALAAADGALAAGHHVAGLVSYEAGFALEPRLEPLAVVPAGAVPLVALGVYDAPEAVDADDLRAALAEAGRVSISEPVLAWTEDAYRAAVARVREHIRAGDVYQINLTAPLRFSVSGGGLALYAALRERQAVAYGAYVRLDGAEVASVSPELFFRVDRDGDRRTVTARPMKGTAPRAARPEADRALAEALRQRPKDRAENLMIVDLLRNDLGRVAQTGSVRVPALFEAERYATVTQMTSTVAATLRPEVQLSDLFGALFPCGSVTGAPKVRAMEIIRDVEAGPRGVYCGAVGSASPDGTAAFSVAIRTAVVEGGRGRYDIGSGIVWDSEPAAEYAECWLKARALTDLA